MKFGTDILKQADVLAAFTEDAPRVTRTYLSKEHRQAGDYILTLMRDAGMTADYDAMGNVVGRYEAGVPFAPIVMTGSHQDSVRNAGKYDGLFGILSPIACVKALHARGKRLPYTLEIVAFGDEEGVRFGVTLIGSKAMAGNFDPAWLEKRDANGVSMRQAITDFGGDPDAWRDLDRRGEQHGEVVAFVESHIEQGPTLLDEGLAVGVVTAIAGATRMNVKVTGLAGHAGTVPMTMRQDALAAASEMVLAVERYCRENAGLVGTVGKMSVLPGAVNVIPQDVDFTVDVRSGNDALRTQAISAIRAEFTSIAARRNVKVDANPFFELKAAPCDELLQQQFAAAIKAQGIEPRFLPSGAGHDAMEFPSVCPIAMLFVRCGNGGISHHPSETMTAEDAEVATATLLHFFEQYQPPVFVPDKAQRVDRT
ncbi:MAG: allantoate amidohydrolase [Burkholderiales bacterium]|nr:MAG: allantoate amidohydrolase [Betaproteobacteria bacterium]TAG24573.1 MAG: allantoate amidohydrolase [Burkholderiales bacterium]